MAKQGFIVNDAEVTGIGTSYAAAKKILLHEDSTADPLSKRLPQACYISHLDLQLDETSATVGQVSCVLAWDSDGDDPMAGESAGNVVWSGLTDTSLRNTSIALDVYVTAPTGQTTSGKCYLWVKVDSGAVTLKKARLHWAIGPTR
tara:strand:- start:24 stop:461 length:438 start_codon:yes stop_codon:yes gene_type:complete